MPFFVEEIVELDVVAVLGGAADPLAVADDQVAELAVRVELVEEAVGIARPRHELELHLDAGLGGEVLRQLDQRVGRVPSGPAQGERLRLGGSGRDRNERRDSRQRGCSEQIFCHGLFSSFGRIGRVCAGHSAWTHSARRQIGRV